jgi:uncharacterized Zn finger protein
VQARFSKGVMERICLQGTGLFPKPSEIKFSCGCPDDASICKHVAAALLGVGTRLDTRPELLFRLRGVNENDLVAPIGAGLPMTKRGPAAGKMLETDVVPRKTAAVAKTPAKEAKGTAAKPVSRRAAPARKKAVAPPVVAAWASGPAPRKMARTARG